MSQSVPNPGSLKDCCFLVYLSLQSVLKSSKAASDILLLSWNISANGQLYIIMTSIQENRNSLFNPSVIIRVR